MIPLPWLAAAAGAVLMAIAAHVAVPFWPVPLTLQSLVALCLGAALGPVAAAASVGIWIAAGVVGLPVFAAGAGPAVLWGPTGGFILGFLPAAMIAGFAARRGWFATVWMAALAFVVADAVLFAAGVAWLAALIGFRNAIAGGLTPFLVGEAIKIGLATTGATLLSGRRSRPA